MTYQEFMQSKRPVDDLRLLIDSPYNTPEIDESAAAISGFAYAGSYAIGRVAEDWPDYQRGVEQWHLQIGNHEWIGTSLETLEIALFYWLGRFAGQTAELSLFDRLALAARSTDLDESARYIQDALGVESGDYAGLFFSGPEYEPEQWAAMEPAERWSRLVDYAAAEMRSKGMESEL